MVIEWPVWHNPVGTDQSTSLNQDLLIESLPNLLSNLRAPLVPIWFALTLKGLMNKIRKGEVRQT